MERLERNENAKQNKDILDVAILKDVYSSLYNIHKAGWYFHNNINLTV